MEESGQALKARPYQEEIVKQAVQQNSIVCLATGTGKTFIGAMVMRELFDGNTKKYRENGTRIFFVVNSVPLVTQQAKEIGRDNFFKVGEYRGDMDVDSWDTAKWISEFDKIDVFVMTGQILCNLLHQSKILPHHMSLLIFDECHNASGNHNYNQILEFLNLYENQNQIPHILGLTASIINEKYKRKTISKESIDEFLSSKMKGLERRMRSKCITCADPYSAMKRKPDESILTFTPGTDVCDDFKDINILIFEYIDIFDEAMEEFAKQKASAQRRRNIDDIDMSELLSLHRTVAKSGGAVIAYDAVKYLKEILETLGPICVYEACQLLLVELEKHKSGRLHESCLERCVEIIEKFMQKYKESVAKTEFQIPDNVYPIQPFVTRKASTFLHDVIYKEKVYFEEQDTTLHAIVFTQRRCTAVILSRLINIIVVKDMASYSGTWSEYILGHTMDTNIKLADCYMKSKHQDKILDRFRRKEFNILVATSVVEEGIDVPKCNLVVRFDGVNNYREYVQSKGRARSERSKYIILSDVKDEDEAKRSLKVMQLIEIILYDKCHNRDLPTQEEIEEATLNEDAQLLPSYFSNGAYDSARITRHSAVGLLYKYCSKLSKDIYFINNPTFTEAIKRNDKFKTTCILPSNCPLKQRSFTSPFMDTKDNAKRAVCLQICRLLHEAGELDEDHLQPVTHLCDSDDEMGDEKGNGIEGTKKAREIYERKIPAQLKYGGNFSFAQSDCYVISMTLASPDEFALYMWDIWYKENMKCFGIFLPKGLRKVPPIDVYIKAGKVSIELRKLSGSFNISESTFQRMQLFHKNLILESSLKFVLGEAMKFDFNHSNVCKALIVPLKYYNEFEDTVEELIDYDVLESLGHDHDKSLVNRVIRKTYMESNTRDYLVLQLSDVTTDDTLDKNSKTTFIEYYKKKYDADLKKGQYLLKTIPCSSKISYKDKEGESSKYNYREEKLVGELCELSSKLHIDHFEQMKCLPYFLYALENFISMENLKNKFSNILIISSNCISVHGSDIDMELKSEDNAMNILQDMLRNTVKVTETTLSPTAFGIWECLTTRQARFPFDLERLEMLGDSFLKVAVTIYLFFEYSNKDEGKLTRQRSRIICNKNLLKISKSLELQNIICNSQFGISTQDMGNKNPLTTWLPPGYVRDNLSTAENETEGTYQVVQDKSLADSVEALIGLYLKTGGINLALKFMNNVLNMKVFFDDISDPTEANVIEGTTSLYSDYPISDSALREETEKLKDDVNQLYQKNKLYEIEKVLKYKFQDKSHLVQAMTHLSCPMNQATGCYQRYEFLGDAILDFLVTNHIYVVKPTLSPGDLTSLRSALVNNNTFGLLAIKFDLWKHLLHRSKGFFDESKQFVKVVESDDIENLFKNSFIIVPSSSNEGYHAPKIFGDIIESLAGAVFIDSQSSIIKVWEVFYPLMKPVIDRYIENVPYNPVKELMEKYASAKFEYESDSTTCTATLIINGEEKAKGIGNNKKVAKATACAVMLREENRNSMEE